MGLVFSKLKESVNHFFHDLLLIGERAFAESLPYETQQEVYGKQGEKSVYQTLVDSLPDARIYKNVLIIDNSQVKGEIDILLLYNKKIFAIEVKHWKGSVYQKNNIYYQEKNCETKTVRSPFAQLHRNIYFLKKSCLFNGWINDIVYFEDADDILLSDENVWFDNYEALISYIQYDGEVSKDTDTPKFIGSLVCADELLSSKLFGEKSYLCRVKQKCLRLKDFQQNVVELNLSKVKLLNITHHIKYDEVYVIFENQTIQTLISDTQNITVLNHDGTESYFGLSKIDKIQLNTPRLR